MLAGWEVLEQSICHGYKGMIWQEREFLEGKKPWIPEDEGSLKGCCRSSGDRTSWRQDKVRRLMPEEIWGQWGQREQERLERGIWSFVYKSEEIIEKRTGGCLVEDDPAWDWQRRVDFSMKGNLRNSAPITLAMRKVGVLVCILGNELIPRCLQEDRGRNFIDDQFRMGK